MSNDQHETQRPPTRQSQPALDHPNTGVFWIDAAPFTIQIGALIYAPQLLVPDLPRPTPDQKGSQSRD